MKTLGSTISTYLAVVGKRFALIADGGDGYLASASATREEAEAMLLDGTVDAAERCIVVDVEAS